MTASAIPEHLDEFVYDLALSRKHYQQISDRLWERHQVRASRMAVASCIARVKEEKRRQLFELTEDGLAGGVATLDRLFRESQAFALEAVEGHQLQAGLRAIDQQLRILKFYRAEQQAQAAAEQSARRDPSNTLQPVDEPKADQGVGPILQGVKSDPATVAAKPHRTPSRDGFADASAAVWLAQAVERAAGEIPERTAQRLQALQKLLARLPPDPQSQVPRGDRDGEPPSAECYRPPQPSRCA